MVKRINYCNLFTWNGKPSLARLILEKKIMFKLIMARSGKKNQNHCRHRIILIIFMRFKELIHSLFLMNRCLQLSPIYDTYFTVSRQSYDFKTKRFLESMFKTAECNNQNKQTWNKVPRLCFNSTASGACATM